MIKQLIEILKEHFNEACGKVKDEAWGKVKDEDDFHSGKATGLDLALHELRHLQEKVRCENCKHWTTVQLFFQDDRVGECNIRTYTESLSEGTSKKEHLISGYDNYCKSWEEKE